MEYNSDVYNSLLKFLKDLYMEHPDVKHRSDHEVDKFCKRHDINCIRSNIARPITTIDGASFPDYVLDQIKS